MIEVSYDEAIENEALRRGREMVENGLYNRMGFNYGQRINKAKLGCIGEAAFKRLLDEDHIDYETDTRTYRNRNSDDFDFKINGKIIDIKVAKSEKNPLDGWTYGYPVDQINHPKDYVVVGVVKESERAVKFYGWIRFDEISNYPQRTGNTFAGFNYSTRNYEFPYGDLNKDFDALWRACRS